MSYDLQYIISLGKAIATYLKSFANFLLMPLYNLPEPPIGAPIWRGFLGIVRLLDPSGSLSVFMFFITVGITVFVSLTIVKWILDIIT